MSLFNLSLFSTLEIHLFSRHANKNVKQLTVLSDHCKQGNKGNLIMLFWMHFEMLKMYYYISAVIEAGTSRTTKISRYVIQFLAYLLRSESNIYKKSYFMGQGSFKFSRRAHVKWIVVLWQHSVLNEITWETCWLLVSWSPNDEEGE